MHPILISLFTASLYFSSLILSSRPHVYGIDGSKRTTQAKGLNIIRMNEGTARKVVR